MEAFIKAIPRSCFACVKTVQPTIWIFPSVPFICMHFTSKRELPCCFAECKHSILGIQNTNGWEFFLWKTICRAFFWPASARKMLFLSSPFPECIWHACSDTLQNFQMLIHILGLMIKVEKNCQAFSAWQKGFGSTSHTNQFSWGYSRPTGVGCCFKFHQWQETGREALTPRTRLRKTISLILRKIVLF